jgi:peptidyl-prolyl cis-trans isomerase A (cyclophilin A)
MPAVLRRARPELIIMIMIKALNIMISNDPMTNKLKPKKKLVLKNMSRVIVSALALILALCVCVVHTQQAPSNFVVAFVMQISVVRINITRAWAPLGVDRFYQLLTLPNGGYYAQNGFFRVVPGFVVQFGISGNTTLSQQWESANIQDDPVVASNTPGTICFATAGPNTRTTQLFINYGNNSRLDAQGCVVFVVSSSCLNRAIFQHSHVSVPVERCAVHHLNRFAPFGVLLDDGLQTMIRIINAKYGEQPDQDAIYAQGNSYLQQNFPDLTYLVKTVIE